MRKFIVLNALGKRVYVDSDSIHTMEEEDDGDGGRFTSITTKYGCNIGVDNTINDIVQRIGVELL